MKTIISNLLFTLTISILMFSSLHLNAQTKSVSSNLETVKIKTSAVCGMCKETIENALAYEKGVKKATLDPKTKICTVEYNNRKTTIEKIRLAISNCGYDADDVKANANAYSKLSPCCKSDVAPH